MKDFLLTIVTAVSTFMTAFLMYRAVVLRITAKAAFSGFDLESQKPIFWLTVNFTDTTCPVEAKSIEVTGAKIPEVLCNAAGEFICDPDNPGKYVFGKIPLRMGLAQSNIPCLIAFPIILLNPHSPIVEVEVRYNLFRRARARALCEIPQSKSDDRLRGSALQFAEKVLQ